MPLFEVGADGTVNQIAGNYSGSGGGSGGAITFDDVYPVGSIYISTQTGSTASPASMFGGTWARITDKFLLASGSSYVIGSTGGSANAIIPSHSHTFSGNNMSGTLHMRTTVNADTFAGSSGVLGYTNSGSSYKWNQGHSTGNTGKYLATITFSGTPSGSISTEGSSVTGANMPPYQVVDVWERIA